MTIEIKNKKENMKIEQLEDAKKEFNLSSFNYYSEKDVKEFIELLKNEIEKDAIGHEIGGVGYNYTTTIKSIIDKLAGENLK